MDLIIELTYTGLGKQILEGHKQNLVHTRTQEKGAVIPQETESGLPMSVQESLVKAWVCRGLVQAGVLSAVVPSEDLLKEVPITFITSTIVWSQVK